MCMYFDAFTGGSERYNLSSTILMQTSALFSFLTLLLED